MAGREEIRGEKSILQWLIRGTQPEKQTALTEKIIQKAEDSDLEERERIKSIRLLGFSNHPQVLEVMRTALRPDASSSIQRAAIQAIVTEGGEEGGKLLTEPEIWKRFTPKDRKSVV